MKPDESIEQFESRKLEHLRIASSSQVQTSSLSGLDQIQLIHEACPDLNYQDVSLNTSFLNFNLKYPFFISSMTAGHPGGLSINCLLAEAAERHGILMGVGSQRRELYDSQSAKEWIQVRKLAPKAVLFGNIGIAQLIVSKPSEILSLVDNLQAQGLFVHLNALQEVIQAEGTPNFKGSLQAIKDLVKISSVPVVIKETGSGMSVDTVHRLLDAGVAAVDLAGLGGTHWGRVEGFRSSVDPVSARVSDTFKNWGLSSVDTLLKLRQLEWSKDAIAKNQIWSSGGVRNGLQIGKLLALGAGLVGMAKPFLEPFVDSVLSNHSEDKQKSFTMKTDPEAIAKELDLQVQFLKAELQTTLFCTGHSDLESFKKSVSWTQEL